MKTVLSVKINPMCELVLSTIILRYKEGNTYWLLEEYGTIEALCIKYQINRENDYYDTGHLVGRKCKTGIKEGITIFKGYN